MEKQLRIALAGNPNSGKTTLFNKLTGSNQFVGNWPGVTVEKKEGKLIVDKEVVLTDLPGIYSLSPYTLEEVVARNYLIEEKPDAILNIVDATNLERNLYLTTQLTELGIPVVIALNMMDLVKKAGDSINVKELSRQLGCRIVEISALKGDGVQEAAKAAIESAKNGKTIPQHSFSGPVEHALAHIEEVTVHNLPEAQGSRHSISVQYGRLYGTAGRMRYRVRICDRAGRLRDLPAGLRGVRESKIEQAGKEPRAGSNPPRLPALSCELPRKCACIGAAGRVYWKQLETNGSRDGFSRPDLLSITENTFKGDRPPMRKTKIVCTIGPSSEKPEVFREMCLNGLNVARLNFSHGTHEEHQKKIDMIKVVREELGLPIAIMLDTKGPEYRIRTFKEGKISLRDGDDFTFTTRDVEGDAHIVSVSYKGLADDLEVGDRVLVNNGLVIFEVTAIEGTEIRCRTVVGGVLSDRKSMSFPGKVMRQVYMSEQDKADLLFGIENGVDFVAASFVSCKQDLLDLRGFLHEHGGDGIDIIAKIENQSGVDNIDEICSACEGIMVARGDLGVEVPFTELPAIQKHLITKCRMLGKRVITATEMLESMINNPRPTRAEISDVANAVYDGTSAIMLSGESAAG